MTAGGTSRQIAILSAISSGLLAIGALSYLSDPALMESTLPSRLVGALALVGSPAKFSAIQPGDTFNSTSLPSMGLAVSLIIWIPQAREIVHAEQESTLTERDAFKRFRDRIAALESSSTASKTPPHGHGYTHSIDPHLSSSSRTDRLTAIKEAYQETVQSTPHYDDEYGDPLIQSMAIEFGEELPTAIMTNSQLTPTLQQAVIEAATAASLRRTAFSNRLDEEAAALTDAQQTLTTVREEYEQVTAHHRHQQSVDELRETHQHLTTCIATCEDLLDERQTQRTEGHTAIPRTDELVDLQEYLYRPLDVTYPVLVDGTAVLGRCVTARGRVEDDLMHRLQ